MAGGAGPAGAAPADFTSGAWLGTRDLPGGVRAVGEFAPAVAHVPLDPTGVIVDWQKRATAAARGADTEEARDFLKSAGDALRQMHVDNVLGGGTETFALTKGGLTDIQAIATVTVKEDWDLFGAEKVKKVDVHNLVVSPLAEGQGAIASHLLRMITEWTAHPRGDITFDEVAFETGSDQLKQYYERLGFRLIFMNGRYVVSGPSDTGSVLNAQEYRLITLVPTPDASFIK